MELENLQSITVTLITGEKKLYGGVNEYQISDNGNLHLAGEGFGVIIADGQWVEFYAVPIQAQAESARV